MTSVSSRRFKLGFFTAASFLLAGTSAVEAQAPGYVSPSPYGYTGRLANSNLGTSGFRNAGFQNTGFRNSGFQNAGFRNSAISNSGFGNGNYGARFANYPSNALGNQGGFNQPASPLQSPTDLSNGGYNSSPQPNTVGLNPPGMMTPTSDYVPDNTATIVVGPGTNLTSGYSMPPISRGARFTVGLGFASPAGTTNPRLSQELQQQFANSQRFASGKDINVSVENNVVVLRGKVADDHERELAEMVVRLSPGVYDVRNELQVGGIVASGAQ